MNKKKNLTFFAVLICCALFQSETGAAAAGGGYDENRHETEQTISAKCQRHGVVWSGGIALRFSDRIRPRPIRSRWERDGDNGIFCRGTSAFEQYTVSDQPWVR